MKLIARFFGFLLTVALVGAIAGFVMLSRYAIDLPNYQELATHEYPAVTRVLASDGRLLAEYAIEKRVFVPIRVVPKKVIDAFLSAEDKTFYEHPRVHIPGLLRPPLTNFLTPP